MFKKIFTALLLLYFCQNNWGLAQPSLNGATGLLELPTADVVKKESFGIGIYSADDVKIRNMGYGLSEKLEVSFANEKHDIEQINKFNVKYVLLSETVLTPGLAVGINDLTGKSERSTFAVVSKGLPLGFRVHAGIGSGDFEKGFVALEKNITPLLGANVFPSTTLLVEYNDNNINYGMRMSIVPDLKLNLGRSDHKTFIGLTYAK